MDIDAETQKGLDALYSAIGFTIVRWAMVEQSLDNCVAIIYHDYGGKPLMKGRGVPVSLSTKLKFLADAFRKLTPLAAFRVHAHDVLAEVRRLKELRHNMIHAALNSVEAVEGVFSFTKLDYDGDHHVAKPFELDLRSFPSQSEDFSALAFHTHALARWLLEHRRKP